MYLYEISYSGSSGVIEEEWFGTREEVEAWWNEIMEEQRPHWAHLTRYELPEIRDREFLVSLASGAGWADGMETIKEYYPTMEERAT